MGQENELIVLHPTKTIVLFFLLLTIHVAFYICQEKSCQTHQNYDDLEIWNPEHDLNFDFDPRENYGFFDTMLDTDSSFSDLYFEENDGYIYMYGNVPGVPLLRKKVESDEWEKVESSFISENEFAFDLENDFFYEDDGEEDELLVLVRNDDDDEEISYEFENYIDDDWDFEIEENWGVKQFY